MSSYYTGVLLCTCAGADGFFANNVSQQVVLVQPGAVLGDGNGPLVPLRPQVDHLVVGVGIWKQTVECMRLGI